MNLNNRHIFIGKVIVSALAMLGAGLFVPGLVMDNMPMLIIGAIILGSIVLGSIIYSIIRGYKIATVKDILEEDERKNNHNQYKK